MYICIYLNRTYLFLSNSELGKLTNFVHKLDLLEKKNLIAIGLKLEINSSFPSHTLITK